jgi:pyruvate kinase
MTGVVFMRKTKIVCTIGPASEDKDTLRQMMEMGMNIARLNFSHGIHAEHKKRIETIRTTALENNKTIARFRKFIISAIFRFMN